MLNGAAVMLVVALLTVNVVNSLALGGISGYAPSASIAFPRATVFLVTTVAALAAMGCFFGAYALSVRVRYIATGPSTGTQQDMPPG
jgi:hypothetical protein